MDHPRSETEKQQRKSGPSDLDVAGTPAPDVLLLVGAYFSRPSAFTAWNIWTADPSLKAASGW